MSRTISIAPVRKSVLVNATPGRAFEVFTAHIDRWWPKSHNIGSAPIRRIAIEPRVGGRWYNDLKDGSQVTIGHVRLWEPGRRFIVSWEISPDWKPEPREAFASEVEVQFIAVAEGTTRIEVEHRDFERMGEPGGTKMRGEVDNGWPAILRLAADEILRG